MNIESFKTKLKMFIRWISDCLMFSKKIFDRYTYRQKLLLILTGFAVTITLGAPGFLGYMLGIIVDNFVKNKGI